MSWLYSNVPLPESEMNRLRHAQQQGSADTAGPNDSSAKGHSSPKPRFLHEKKIFTYEGSVFDKLVDPALYTGIHKRRFDARGKGMGLLGRDSTALHADPGDIPSCSGEAQMTRWANGLRRDTTPRRQPMKGTNSFGGHFAYTPFSSYSSTTTTTTATSPSRRNNSPLRGGDMQDRGRGFAHGTASGAHGQLHQHQQREGRQKRSAKDSDLPPFESYVMDADGNLILDEQRTHQLYHGPFTTFDGPSFQERLYRPQLEVGLQEQQQQQHNYNYGGGAATAARAAERRNDVAYPTGHRDGDENPYSSHNDNQQHQYKSGPSGDSIYEPIERNNPHSPSSFSSFPAGATAAAAGIGVGKSRSGGRTTDNTILEGSVGGDRVVHFQDLVPGAPARALQPWEVRALHMQEEKDRQQQQQPPYHHAPSYERAASPLQRQGGGGGGDGQQIYSNNNYNSNNYPHLHKRERSPATATTTTATDTMPPRSTYSPPASSSGNRSPWDARGTTSSGKFSSPSLHSSGSGATAQPLPHSPSSRTQVTREGGGGSGNPQRMWVNEARRPAPPTLDELMHLVERYERFHPGDGKSTLQ